MVPAVQCPAPKFKCLGSDGKTYSLNDFNSKPLVLYFYPKDDTSGCTLEACNFRDSFTKIKKLATLVGVSPDPIRKHAQFIEKYELPFLLLADEDKSICQAYGVWVEKSMYGRKYMGVARTTFIINTKGIITHVFEKVKPADHHNEVLNILKTTS